MIGLIIYLVLSFVCAFMIARRMAWSDLINEVPGTEEYVIGIALGVCCGGFWPLILPLWLVFYLIGGRDAVRGMRRVLRKPMTRDEQKLAEITERRQSINDKERELNMPLTTWDK